MPGEEQKIKKKINGLIDHITELENDLESRKAHIQLLKDQIKMLEKPMIKGESEGIPMKQESIEESRIFAFMRDFCVITRLIILNKDYIPYNYETKNSAFYYKVEQGILDDYICHHSRMDIKNFLNYCVDLGLVKAEKNRKCLYPSGSIRVYYINRLFMDAAAKDVGTQLQEA